MPYEPGQPWDPALSYTTGQTCTYRGLPYVYFHPTLPSTVGVPPNADIKKFTATSTTIFGQTDERDERAWVLADESQSGGFFGYPDARYGNVRRLQFFIRGIDPSLDITKTATMKYEGGIYPGFFTLQVGNLYESTWNFYGSEGMSLESGLANPVGPVPSTDGNPNVKALAVAEPSYGAPSDFLPSIPYATVGDVFPTQYEVKVYFTINTETPYAPTFINEFNRDASYTITVTPPGGGTAYTIEDTINSGPFRDGFTLQSTSNVKTHLLPTGSVYTFKVNNLTPRFDN